MSKVKLFLTCNIFFVFLKTAYAAGFIVGR